MQSIFPNQGLIYTLDRLAGNTPDDGLGLTWHLYTNDITPTRTTVLTDFALADIDLGVNTFDSGDLNVKGISSNVGIILRTEAVFANASGGDVVIYGWVVTDISDSKVISCARLDGAPFTVGDGTSFTIVPELSGRSFFP